MSTKNSLVAFLFLASHAWSQQQVPATSVQTSHKLILTPTLAQVSDPAIHSPQGASSPIFVAVAAVKGVPFKGSLEGHETIVPISPQFLSSVLKGTGNATHLGSFTVIKMDFVNLVTSIDLGSLAFTA